MRVSELARATGVSAQTIHYYLREGLLPPPTKTAPNMAYYDAGYVEDIRLIKDLQEKRYLPLSVIRLVLDAKRQGKDVSQLQDMRLSLDDLFRPLGPEEELSPVSLPELVAMAGVAATTLEDLESMGLLSPAFTAEGRSYDGIDVRIARAIKTLLGLGLEPADLGFYAQYVDALRTEVSVIGQRIVAATGGGQVRGTVVKAALDDLKAALAAKVYRQAALGLQREGVSKQNAG